MAWTYVGRKLETYRKREEAREEMTAETVLRTKFVTKGTAMSASVGCTRVSILILVRVLIKWQRAQRTHDEEDAASWSPWNDISITDLLRVPSVSACHDFLPWPHSQEAHVA